MAFQFQSGDHEFPINTIVRGCAHPYKSVDRVSEFLREQKPVILIILFLFLFISPRSAQPFGYVQGLVLGASVTSGLSKEVYTTKMPCKETNMLSRKTGRVKMGICLLPNASRVSPIWTGHAAGRRGCCYCLRAAKEVLAKSRKKNLPTSKKRKACWLVKTNKRKTFPHAERCRKWTSGLIVLLKFTVHQQHETSSP